MLGRQHIYAVLVKEGDGNPLESTRFVREGFNFFAFLFTCFWAGYQRMWFAAALLLSAHMLIFSFEHYGWFSHPSITMLHFFVQVIAGFHGHDWLTHSLQRRGYKLSDVVMSDSLLKAQQRYFDSPQLDTRRAA